MTRDLQADPCPPLWRPPTGRCAGEGDRGGLAFTLIELLVVVSIVALLIALLLPAIGKAKTAAERTLCLSRIRQASIALVVYTTEHQSYFPAFPNPLADAPNHVQHQYGTWIPPLLPYVNTRPPIKANGQPLTASDLSAYYPITGLLRTEQYQALQCPSDIYGLWAGVAADGSGYRHAFFGIQNLLRRHYNSPSEPLGGPYVPWKIHEIRGKAWTFGEAGYLTTITGVAQIRTYGFTVSIPADGVPRSSPQHDGWGNSLARLDGSAAFVAAREQYVAPTDAPWEYGSTWAPYWSANKWGPPPAVYFPNN